MKRKREKKVEELFFLSNFYKVFFSFMKLLKVDELIDLKCLVIILIMTLVS